MRSAWPSCRWNCRDSAQPDPARVRLAIVRYRLMDIEVISRRASVMPRALGDRRHLRGDAGGASGVSSKAAAESVGDRAAGARWSPCCWRRR
jgi:hypothetical protein